MTTQPASPSPATVKQSPVNFSIGLKILVEPIGTNTKSWTELVGAIKGKFIMIRPPSDPNVRAFLKTGSEVKLRFLHDECFVSGFVTTVATSIASPHPIVFLRYPNKIETQNLRQHDRVPCFIPVLFFLDGEEYPGQIVNISKGGCKIVLDPESPEHFQNVAEEADVFLQISLTGVDDPLYIGAKVRAKLEHDNSPAFGLQFEDITSDIELSLIDFIERVRKYGEF